MGNNRRDRKRRRENHRIAKLKNAEPKPGRLEMWKNNPLIYMIACAVVIAYPFFTIKYFETHTAQKLVVKYFLLPIFIVLVIVGPKFYMKHSSLKGKKQLSKFGNFVLMAVFILFSTGIFYWMCFSLIITTNKWFDSSETVIIQERVTLYFTNITKNGTLRHYIQITDPKTKEKIDLEVYRKYDVGEFFEKEMHYGAWGILYSTK